MDLVHERIVVALGQEFRIVGDCGDQWLQPVLVAFGEIVQHITVHHVLAARMPNADPHLAVILADGV